MVLRKRLLLETLSQVVLAPMSRTLLAFRLINRISRELLRRRLLMNAVLINVVIVQEVVRRHFLLVALIRHISQLLSRAH